MNTSQILKGKAVILLCLFVFLINLVFSVFFRLNENSVKYKTILEGNDAKGYYEYLPWLLNNKDINYANDYSYEVGEKRMLKYPYGVALLQAPFYAMAKVFSTDANAANNLNYTYSFFISLGASIFIALACMFIVKMLNTLEVTNRTKCLAIVVIYFGTNLFHYCIMEPMMSHVYTFFAVAMFLYAFVNFKNHKTTKYLSLFYLSVFLIVAIRPFNVLIILPFIGYLFYSNRNFSFLIKVFFVIGLSIFIQLLLWRLQAGAWVLSTYNGEGFNWTNPQLLNVLVSFRKGLFIYSPVLVLSILGLVIAIKKQKKYSVLLVSTLLVFTFIISCWWHWPFGDSFGHRAFIDVYPLLIIGIVYLIENTKTVLYKGIVYGFITLCILLNVIQTWQYNHGIILAEYMTFEKYKYEFLYVDEHSKNNLGGINDIQPFGKDFKTVKDTMPLVNFDFNDYSKPYAFKNAYASKNIFLEVSFTKHEIKPNQSNLSKMFISMQDKSRKVIYETAFLINETPNDCSEINTKRYNYQIKLPTITNCDSLKLFFTNPQRKKFLLDDIVLNYKLY